MLSYEQIQATQERVNCCGRCIRGFDQFGVPVNLKFRQKQYHKTFLGGMCSFIALALVLFFTLNELFDLFVQPDFQVQAFVNYLQLESNLQSYAITPDQFTIAAMTMDYNEELVADLNSYVVPMFWSRQATPQGSWSSFYKAKPCTEMYAAYPKSFVD